MPSLLEVLGGSQVPSQSWASPDSSWLVRPLRMAPGKQGPALNRRTRLEAAPGQGLGRRGRGVGVVVWGGPGGRGIWMRRGPGWERCGGCNVRRVWRDPGWEGAWWLQCGGGGLGGEGVGSGCGEGRSVGRGR